MTRRRNRHKPKAYYMKNNHIYIVLEHAELGVAGSDGGCINVVSTDAWVHGVYTHRDMADKKVEKLISESYNESYICVLKKRISGNIYTEERSPYDVLHTIFDW